MKTIQQHLAEQPATLTFEKVTMIKASNLPGFADESATYPLIEDWHREEVAKCLAEGWTVTRRWLATPATRTTVELPLCEYGTHDWDYRGYCEDCGAPQPDYEPGDNHMPGLATTTDPWDQS